MWRQSSGYDREVLVRVVRGDYALKSWRKFGENDKEGKWEVSSTRSEYGC